jgi:hypothetical protein
MNEEHTNNFNIYNYKKVLEAGHEIKHGIIGIYETEPLQELESEMLEEPIVPALLDTRPQSPQYRKHRRNACPDAREAGNSDEETRATSNHGEEEDRDINTVDEGQEEEGTRKNKRGICDTEEGGTRKKKRGICNREEWTGRTRGGKEDSSTHTHTAVIPVSQNIKRPLRTLYNNEDSDEDVPSVSCGPLDTDEEEKFFSNHPHKAVIPVSQRRYLRHYIKKAHPEKPVNCKVKGCREKNLPEDTAEHLKTHEKKFRCKTCPKSYDTKNGLDRHIRTSHI